jgi:hypothetical protein
MEGWHCLVALLPKGVRIHRAKDARSLGSVLEPCPVFLDVEVLHSIPKQHGLLAADDAVVKAPQVDALIAKLLVDGTKPLRFREIGWCAPVEWVVAVRHHEEVLLVPSELGTKVL